MRFYGIGERRTNLERGGWVGDRQAEKHFITSSVEECGEGVWNLISSFDLLEGR